MLGESLKTPRVTSLPPGRPDLGRFEPLLLLQVSRGRELTTFMKTHLIMRFLLLPLKPIYSSSLKETLIV